MPLVLVRTPLRISLFGGGTDLPAFYSQQDGHVLSAAIDKYSYVLLKSRMDEGVHANWMQKEVVARVRELRHELIREALLYVGVDNGVEVTTLGDLPAGSGLGSSSSITVGLLSAASVYLGKAMSSAELAKAACDIELGVLRKPIGRQDQYICAFGGVRELIFHRDDTVEIGPATFSASVLQRLEERLMLFFTGTTRAAAPILGQIKRSVETRRETMAKIGGITEAGIEALRASDWAEVGSLLDRSWRLKRDLNDKVANSDIDTMYAAARDAGAFGGKITGAGGGGFMLLLVDPGRREAVRAALRGRKEVGIRIAGQGAHPIFLDDRA